MKPSDYFSWADRTTRKREEIREEVRDLLEPTQPVQVVEHQADTATVRRIREHMVVNKRGER